MTAEEDRPITQPPHGWDDWLLDVGTLPGFCQSSAWARVDEYVNGVRPYFLRDSTEPPSAGLLVGWHPPGDGLFGRIGSNTFIRRGSLFAKDGPVLRADIASADALAEIVEQLDRLAHQLRIKEVSLDVSSLYAPWVLENANRDVFQARNYSCSRYATSVIELRTGDEDLLASFDRQARKSIRRARDAGVVVAHCKTRETFTQTFAFSYLATSEGAGRSASRDRLLRSWDADPEGRYYRYFVASSSDGEILGTLGTYRYRGVATEIASSLAPRARDLHLPAQDLLHAEVFRWHLETGDRFFDLAGFAVDPRTPKEAGIRRFKAKWGGAVYPVFAFRKSFRRVF